MPSSDWRAPAAYAHADHISAAGFAWEYLRRDEAYRRDFRRMKAIRSENPNARIAFSERWGLRFRDRSRSTCRPRATVLAAVTAA
ncbi:MULTISPECIES: DUF6499 domain-containing protein [Bacteria]|uniref:transcriptional regulator domain-containing protein n=1 Tax=Bacteria TaxID=2 RepID=UPI0024484BC7|nr:MULTISPECIES: DUF6499 domain-containing protein [unclassified Agrobacterium]MDH0612684.1 DUF6499 domain-containing protein [Agrobacterium sp. GD03872]MDH0694548.1 DUF6499 domain-containing protein [Agrobacterium sp. GD03871]MDH1058054.1 DUF6499 domain-containing protein [Agrobacterium sp. GD03992]MDH2209343.1 DUF6499 domain-containing protein [Agrobacterium sp. GD03643]MDH2218834.1 DUF6499 domain-containing protein [Agrobacterium sp. GD03638]